MSATLKKTKQIYRKVDGSFKRVSAIWRKVNGTWQQIYSPYAFGGYVKEGLVLQLDCRRKPVEFSPEEGTTVWKYDNLAKDSDVKELYGSYTPDDLTVWAMSSNQCEYSLSQNFLVEICGKLVFEDKYWFGGTLQMWTDKYISIEGGDAYSTREYPCVSINVGDGSSLYNIYGKSVGDVVTASVLFVDGMCRVYIDGVNLGVGFSISEQRQRNIISSIFTTGTCSHRIYIGASANESTILHNRQKDVENFDHSVPTNVVTLQGGEPLKYANGDFVTYKN